MNPVDDRPEFLHYEDDGCEVSGKCVQCPLPACKYDNARWYSSTKRMVADVIKLEIIQANGLTVAMAAIQFEITVRTVFRVLRRCREATDAQLEDAAMLAALKGGNVNGDSRKATTLPKVRATVIPAALDPGWA